jgi:hypothetical protein
VRILEIPIWGFKMDKKRAENLIFQIQLACPNLDFGGSYSPHELRLKLTPPLNSETRPKVLEIAISFGQKMKEENGLVKIYEV